MWYYDTHILHILLNFIFDGCVWSVRYKTYFRAIKIRMSTGFIWLTIENFRGHHCNNHSDVLTPWFWKSCTNIFPGIWIVQLLINTDYTVLILANSMFYPQGQVTNIMQRQTNGVMLSISWRHARKSSTEYSQLKPHAHCVCAAFSVTVCSTV